MLLSRRAKNAVKVSKTTQFILTLNPTNHPSPARFARSSGVISQRCQRQQAASIHRWASPNVAVATLPGNPSSRSDVSRYVRGTRSSFHSLHSTRRYAPHQIATQLRGPCPRSGSASSPPLLRPSAYELDAQLFVPHSLS